MVQRLNISLSGDTVERLDQYAYEQHCNSRSQAITHLLWEAKVKNAQLRGQIGLDPESQIEEVIVENEREQFPDNLNLLSFCMDGPKTESNNLLV